MRALSTAMPAARRLLRSDGLQRWFVHEPCALDGAARVIKQLEPSIAVDAEVAERWLNAAARNAGLTHPGCTQVQDWGVYEGSAYVVSQSPGGSSLSGLLDALRASGARLAAELVAPIGIMILEALDYAQQRDPTLTHLDLDLEGVTLRSDGSVVLSEFALWSALLPRELARCRFDSGRVQYCAPELVQSRPGDCRSDIFSVGVLLYQLLTGVRPFVGATQLVIALAIADGQRAPVHERAPEAPERLCDVLEVMLATRADERFQTPAAAATALRSTLCSSAERTRPVRAQPSEPPAAQGEPSAVSTPEPRPPPLCFPVSASSSLARPRARFDAPQVAADVQPEPVQRPRSLPSNVRLPALGSGSGQAASIDVNDGRTAYLRAGATTAPAPPAWSTLAKQDDRWSDPSDTVFRVKARPSVRPIRSTRACTAASRLDAIGNVHVRKALPMSMAVGLVTVIALYLVYRILS